MTSWARLREVRMMLPGWLDGDGEAVTSAAHTWAKQFLTACEERGIPFPRIFPTHEGGVLLEEQPVDIRWSLEIGPDGTAVTIVSGGGVKPLVCEHWGPEMAADALGIFLVPYLPSSTTP
jgi:hypothetical protein